MLWIAFKFVSLYRMTQPATLSTSRKGVVNCFQICIFVSDDTAKADKMSFLAALWIAFKFVSLYRMTQHPSLRLSGIVRCELLSNLYLCIGWHSWPLKKAKECFVVNCFQICIFVSDDTAPASGSTLRRALWIAFKFVSLYRMTQHRCWTRCCSACCELLSNLYLCIGWHSLRHAKAWDEFVVNCFQICIFVSDDTARWPQIITNQSDTKISH